jgi:hypothetical protein
MDTEKGSFKLHQLEISASCSFIKGSVPHIFQLSYTFPLAVICIFELKEKYVIEVSALGQVLSRIPENVTNCKGDEFIWGKMLRFFTIITRCKNAKFQFLNRYERHNS